jgi:hypothetical protein
VAGLWAGLTGPRARNTRIEELTRRKDKLFADLVALEEDHRHQRVDDGRYASRRQTLVSQLERVMGELDRGGGEGVAA